MDHEKPALILLTKHGAGNINSWGFGEGLVRQMGNSTFVDILSLQSGKGQVFFSNFGRFSDV